ncbi:MAG: type II secretion system minor pseudopilin GspK [Ectothiorhodospiraceae bacterium]|jgi:general secretion pathway protein K
MPDHHPRTSRRTPRARNARQSGIALITALLVLAIAAIAAAQMLSSQHLDIRRSQNVLARDQAWVYALSAEEVAIDILAGDRQDNDIDGPGDIWAQQLPPIMEDTAQITLEIEDLQGRYNLNNLATQQEGLREQEGDRFRRLLQTVYPQAAPDVEAAVADWVDADIEPRFPGGAEDDVYTRLDPPYRPANRLMESASELRLVQGMGPQTQGEQSAYEAIRPYVTALPATDLAINVNTASAAVLRSLADSIEPGDAKAAVEARGDKGWEDVQSFMNEQTAFADTDISPQTLTVSSAYFLAHATVTLDRARIDLFSVIHRPKDGPIKVLYRSQVRP